LRPLGEIRLVKYILKAGSHCQVFILIDTLQIPNIVRGHQAGGNYQYDGNGNQTVNKDKRISESKFNHLNLFEEIRFSAGGKIRFAYDAEEDRASRNCPVDSFSEGPGLHGSLTQKAYNSSGTLTKTQDYIGEVVLLNGALDYLVHEEGRIVAEGNQLWSEFFVKDHLGNVRQVLRAPTSQSHVATMEPGAAVMEEQQFSMVSESRQTEPEHNVTVGEG
jgi:hypothetical protein